MTKITGKLSNVKNLSGSVKSTQSLTGNIRTAEGGIKTYAELPDKPMINSNELIGDKSASELKLQEEMRTITPQEIDKLIFGG